ncbi:MAG: nuclear transport factor 2 family protein [Acidimicrobiales bacterium]
MAGIATVLTTLLVVATLMLTVGQADASNSRGELRPGDLTNCFAFSIDQVGRGNLEGGIERFDGCLADDYTFEFVFFEGGPSIVCPGEGCPIQEFSSRAEMRALFADQFFQDAGYLATQHQILNLDVDQKGRKAEVFAYIQANHFLPDNSVDIAWNDYSFKAERDRRGWKVKSEVIVGTAFLNFQGGPVGGGGGESAISEGTDVVLRNTLQDAGEEEATYASLFGQPDDAFDEFGTVSNSTSEFPTALAQTGTPVGDINGLYNIDLTEDSINFEVIAAEDDPFWMNVFGLFPSGKFDRYYLTFSEPHNITSFSSDNPNLNLRIDSEMVVVVELTGGYDLQPGVAFTVDLNP